MNHAGVLVSLMLRTALFVTPRRERVWIHALVAEAFIIEGREERASWTFGLLNLTAVGLSRRVSLALSLPRARLMAGVFIAMIACGGFSQVGYEGRENLDALLLGITGVLAGVLVVLGALMLAKSIHGANPHAT